jgi:hypothetical protein
MEFAGHEITEEEYLRITTILDSFGGFKNIIIHASADEVD